MNKVAENIIAIRKRDISKANEAFADFMSLTENYLNDKAKDNPSLYKDCNGSLMEPIALDALREVAQQTPFRPQEIKLISGAKFPDIQAELYYGVEVKTTLKNSWKSTGSSIVESTRIEDVDMIYMMFAKLGGDFAEFKCKPYEDCLEDIAITHQPRYRIDMELAEKHKETVFQKMNIPYEQFRIKTESEKQQIYSHYKKPSKKNDLEMPWRFESDDPDFSIPMTIRFLKSLSPKERLEMRAKMFLLFPEVLSNKPAKYSRAALWLCSRNSLICNNMRDIFTSGGKVKEIGTKVFSRGVPKILLRLFECRELINYYLHNPQSEMLQDIDEFWQLKLPANQLKDYWMQMVQTNMSTNKNMGNISIKDLMESW